MNITQSITIHEYQVTGFGDFDRFLRCAKEAIGMSCYLGSEGATVQENQIIDNNDTVTVQAVAKRIQVGA